MIDFRPLQWHHNECDCDSNRRRLDCLLSRLFRPSSRKTSKLRVTGLCEGNPPVTGGFPSDRVNNAENVSNWWRHHATMSHCLVRDIPWFAMSTENSNLRIHRNSKEPTIDCLWETSPEMMDVLFCWQDEYQHTFCYLPENSTQNKALHLWCDLLCWS